jgi:hypothetical protein
MKFIICVLLGFVLFAPIYGFLTAHGVAREPAILIFLAIVAAPYFLPGRFWIMLGAFLLLVWLGWGFVYPIYEAVNRSIANGEKAPARLWAAVEQAAETAGEKLLHLPLPAGMAIGSSKNLAHAQEDLQQAEDLCMQLPFTKSFGAGEKGLYDAQTAYCQKQDSGIFTPLKADIDAIKNGVAGPTLPFLQTDPSKLNSDTYYECLQQATLPRPADQPLEAVARSKARANSAECNQPSIQQVPLKRRICMELAIQVPHDDPYVINPLAPEISACRANLTNLSP